MRRDSLAQVAQALNDARIPSLIVGGLAVVAHGYGRCVQTLELLIGPDARHLKAAVEALKRLGYSDQTRVAAASFRGTPATAVKLSGDQQFHVSFLFYKFHCFNE